MRRATPKPIDSRCRPCSCPTSSFGPLQALESRTLLSVPTSAWVVAGDADSTHPADTILIQPCSQDSSLLCALRNGSLLKRHRLKAGQTIVVRAGKGADNIYVRIPPTIRVKVLGGGGNDTIVLHAKEDPQSKPTLFGIRGETLGAAERDVHLGLTVETLPRPSSIIVLGDFVCYTQGQTATRNTSSAQGRGHNLRQAQNRWR